MLFSLLQKRRRRRLLATPFPQEWERLVETIPLGLDEFGICRVVPHEERMHGAEQSE